LWTSQRCSLTSYLRPGKLIGNAREGHVPEDTGQRTDGELERYLKCLLLAAFGRSLMAAQGNSRQVNPAALLLLADEG